MYQIECPGERPEAENGEVNQDPLKIQGSIGPLDQAMWLSAICDQADEPKQGETIMVEDIMKLRVCFDTSAKSEKKAWYILDADAIFTARSLTGITSNMTYNQLCLVKKTLQDLGIPVIDLINNIK